MNLQLQNTNLLFKSLFLVVFWGIWLILPFLNSVDNPGYQSYIRKMIPVNLTLIPLFFFNSEYLVKKIFRSRGATVYVICLILLTAVFTTLNFFLKRLIIGEHTHRANWLGSFFPVLTVVAVSTGYGLIDYLIKQEKAQQEERQQRLRSELSFLRSQISPHFILNVLNSIVYLVRSGSREAETMIIKLSEIMQYMLYNSSAEMVPLDQEISYLENYIELQETRFGEDVQIDFEVSGDVSGKKIEPMLIIPFVENAFKHGTGLINDPVILIKVDIDQQGLSLIVKNKFDPHSGVKAEQSGIGLPNVKRRLELLYPNKHHLEIRENDGWFETHLTLQLESQSENIAV